MKHTLHLCLFSASLFFLQHLEAQVTKLSNNSNIEEGITIGSKTVLVTKKDSIWVSDGTPGGTSKLAVNVSVDSNRNVTVFNNKIYFTGVTATNGYELWVTDGTVAGTQLIKDIATGAGSSSPRDFYVFNSAVYFFAKTDAAGVELWKTDGTSTGTVMVKDINPGADSSYSISANFKDNNGILYFSADDGTHGNELWKTDGTSAGTVIVKDINPGSGSSDPSNITAYTTSIVFSADDGTHGAEPWISNGTAAGTNMIKDINTIATVGSNPTGFVVFNNKVLFTVLDILSGSFQLYTTDGTSANTTVLANVFAFLTNGVILNSKLYFPGQDNAHGLEIWSTDGTAAGTTLFKDINPGSNSSDCIFLVSYAIGSSDIVFGNSNLYNGKIFFIADDGTHGTELWVTDGTIGNTVLVKDINSGTGSAFDNFTGYFYTTSGLYFAADDGTSGNELWKSDATTAGTTKVIDIYSGAPSSDPTFITFLNGHLLFTANDGDNTIGDIDLYRLDATLAPLPVTLLNFTAVLQGKASDLKWSTTQEINSSYFSIERSKDGAQFDVIGKVNAAGNSNIKSDYSFTDANVYSLSVNTVFYRLKMVDKDGKFAYSPVALVSIKPDSRKFYAYPIPAKDHINLVVNSSVSEAQIKITDQTGKEVFVQKINVAQNGSQTRINVSNLKSGVYYLQYISAAGTQTIKFVKN